LVAGEVYVVLGMLGRGIEDLEMTKKTVNP
jgi:hypothetical protein